MVGQLAGLSEGSKPELGKSVGTDVGWRWFSPCAGNSIARSNRGVRDMDCVAG